MPVRNPHALPDHQRVKEFSKAVCDYMMIESVNQRADLVHVCVGALDAAATMYTFAAFTAARTIDESFIMNAVHNFESILRLQARRHNELDESLAKKGEQNGS